MRFPSIPILIRTLYTFTNTTSRIFPATQRTLNSPLRSSFFKTSMPIPFFGALFSSSSSKNMSYPVQKSDDEWQAVLSKGIPFLLSQYILAVHTDSSHQNNSASSARRAQRPLLQENTTNISHQPAYTPALPARHHSTQQPTSSNPAADGPPFSMPCQVRLQDTLIAHWA
jgi:hypothetical protein